MSTTVQVRYFAAARELAQCEAESIELPSAEVSGQRLLEILGERHPRLVPYLGRFTLAINEEIAPGPADVRAGDVIDVLPPVAGGAGGSSGLRDTPLSVDEALAAVSHPGAGGIAVFIGVVRDHAGGRDVARLDYEAHRQLAERELARIAGEVQSEHPDSRVCALHRIGNLRVGDLAVVVAASAPHRAEAFSACRALIERIKASVPIWKKEWSPDGSALWVNLTE